MPAARRILAVADPPILRAVAGGGLLALPSPVAHLIMQKISTVDFSWREMAEVLWVGHGLI
jgi:hypothetical protein